MREDSVSVCRGCGLQQNLSEKWWQDLQLGMGSLMLGEKGWDGMGWDGRVHGRAMGPKRALQVVMRELWDDAGQGGWRAVG